MKIAIVNDTLVALNTLRRIIQSVPDYEIIWAAKNGKEAINKCQENLPDLILMDLIILLRTEVFERIKFYLIKKSAIGRIFLFK